jgi:hypothetical protein
MHPSTDESPENMNEAKLPRRDWILLPLLGVVVVVVLAVSTELIARRTYFSLATGGESCLVRSDPVGGARGIPNSVCMEKIPEGTLTKYRFNSSGYRNDFNFGPKPPGTFRIVMIGTSMVAGFRVPREETFGALLPPELSRLTGRRIELLNEGMPWRSPRMTALHYDDVFGPKPDLILWVLSPIDIEKSPAEWAAQKDGGSHGEPRHVSVIARADLAAQAFAGSIENTFGYPQTITLLRDFLYGSASQYVKSSLNSSKYQKNFLKTEPGAEWQQRIAEFDLSAASLETQASKEGVPVVAVLLPDRTQVAMISMMGDWPKGFDPYKLNNELRAAITSHGGIYLDILPDFRSVLNPQRGYFAVDGHLDAHGHEIITGMLARALTSGAVPALSNKSIPPFGPEVAQ